VRGPVRAETVDFFLPAPRCYRHPHRISAPQTGDPADIPKLPQGFPALATAEDLPPGRLPEMRGLSAANPSDTSRATSLQSSSMTRDSGGSRGESTTTREPRQQGKRGRRTPPAALAASRKGLSGRRHRWDPRHRGQARTTRPPATVTAGRSRCRRCRSRAPRTTRARALHSGAVGVITSPPRWRAIPIAEPALRTGADLQPPVLLGALGDDFWRGPTRQPPRRWWHERLRAALASGAAPANATAPVHQTGG
jgi:hypothetical protein